MKFLKLITAKQLKYSVQMVALCTFSLFFLTGYDVATTNSENTYVRNIQEYKEHVDIHRNNVMKLGLALYDRNPHLFPHTNRKNLYKTLMIHDIEKTLSLTELKEFGYQGTQDFAERTYEFYKMDKSQLEHEGDSYKLRRTVNELNFFGSKFQKILFRQLGLVAGENTVTKEALEIKLIETAVDLLDTERNKVRGEEFNKRTRIAVQSFLGHAIAGALIELGIDYYKVVGPNPLVEKAKLRSAPSCARLFS